MLKQIIIIKLWLFLQMKESEKDNINLYYVPYVYFDEFPGFSEKFPNGIRVKNVSLEILTIL